LHSFLKAVHIKLYQLIHQLQVDQGFQPLFLAEDVNALPYYLAEESTTLEFAPPFRPRGMARKSDALLMCSYSGQPILGHKASSSIRRMMENSGFSCDHVPLFEGDFVPRFREPMRDSAFQPRFYSSLTEHRRQTSTITFTLHSPGHYPP
jgi:hypothetical protein